jgi:hypothetical protein
LLSVAVRDSIGDSNPTERADEMVTVDELIGILEAIKAERGGELRVSYDYGAARLDPEFINVIEDLGETFVSLNDKPDDLETWIPGYNAHLA